MQAQRPFKHSTKLDTSFTVRGLDRSPTTVQRSTHSHTSTPKTYTDALIGPGNHRRSKNISGTEMTPNSILRNSNNRSQVRATQCTCNNLHVN